MSCIFGHKWNGCKCSKCGKTRNHEWDGCKCKRCGCEQHEWDGCKCKRCDSVKDGEGWHHKYRVVQGTCDIVCTVCGKKSENGLYLRDPHINGVKHIGSKCLCSRCGKRNHANNNHEWIEIKPGPKGIHKRVCLLKCKLCGEIETNCDIDSNAICKKCGTYYSAYHLP